MDEERRYIARTHNRGSRACSVASYHDARNGDDPNREVLHLQARLVPQTQEDSCKV